MFFRSLILFLLSATSSIAAFTVSERLRCGKYQEIVQDAKQPRDGEWAFARYFLVPDKVTYEAAFKAHQAGDLLGKFIVMRCHRDGAGVKQDMTVFWRMNADLRTALTKMENVPAAGYYLLSYLTQADLEGHVDVSKFANADEASRVAGKFQHEHLFTAAKSGFAQAMTEAGARMQKEKPEEALAWYHKAADLGLAEGMRNMGYLVATGKGLPKKDEEEAVRWMRKAATLGDVDAMMNMVAFFELLQVAGVTETEAVEWINKMEATGHPLGYFEKGVALLRGVHGFRPDKPQGMALLQKAAATGNGFVLGQIAWLYSKGEGLPHSHRKAVEFAKASWSQGNIDVLPVLDAAYRQDTELSAKTAEAAYWKKLAEGAKPKEVAELDANNPEILLALDKIDPFALKVE
ncbi:MAG TPA: tetratricopeptide repeat protein [Verrucomicrobiales bacterium]|jgi:TPR repeat protein|nr:tetratricopeptide repeat protein [Verrucomicrobiales bacterium]